MPFLYELFYPAADPYTVFVFADLFDILVFLVVTATHTVPFDNATYGGVHSMHRVTAIFLQI